MAKKRTVPADEGTAPTQKQRHLQKWDPETCRTAAFVGSILSIALLMFLYIENIMVGSIWGWSLAVAAVLTLLAYRWAERSVMVRVLVRVVTWTVGLAVTAYFSVMAVLLYLQFSEATTSHELMQWVAWQGLYSAAALSFIAPPMVAVSRACKAVDIWILRVFSTLGALLVTGGCVFGDIVEWGFDNMYFKIFVCLIVATAAGFTYLIRPMKDDQQA